MYSLYLDIFGDLLQPFFITIKAAAICPTTVAIAAPAMPNSGKNPIPKINNGSRAILTKAPAI